MTYKEPEVEEYWLCMGDPHTGSEVSPMPKKVKLKLLSGGERLVAPNQAQVQLNAVWDKMIENLPPLTGVIVNGDCCDGPNRKSDGRGVWTTDLRMQVQACADLLKPIKKHMRHLSNWYFTLGSEYHVVDDRPLDEAVCVF